MVHGHPYGSKHVLCKLCTVVKPSKQRPSESFRSSFDVFWPSFHRHPLDRPGSRYINLIFNWIILLEPQAVPNIGASNCVHALAGELLNSTVWTSISHSAASVCEVCEDARPTKKTFGVTAAKKTIAEQEPRA